MSKRLALRKIHTRKAMNTFYTKRSDYYRERYHDSLRNAQYTKGCEDEPEIFQYWFNDAVKWLNRLAQRRRYNHV